MTNDGDRYEGMTAEELRAELAHDRSERAREADEARARRRRVLAWVLAAVVVVAIGGGIWWKQAQEQAAQDCLTGQMYDAMIGEEARDC